MEKERSAPAIVAVYGSIEDWKDESNYCMNRFKVTSTGIELLRACVRRVKPNNFTCEHPDHSATHLSSCPFSPALILQFCKGYPYSFWESHSQLLMFWFVAAALKFRGYSSVLMKLSARRTMLFVFEGQVLPPPNWDHHIDHLHSWHHSWRWRRARLFTAYWYCIVVLTSAQPNSVSIMM